MRYSRRDRQSISHGMDLLYMDAAQIWYDVDLDIALFDPSIDREIIYILSRMWLSQMMAEYNVEDCAAAVDFLQTERRVLP